MSDVTDSLTVEKVLQELQAHIEQMKRDQPAADLPKLEAMLKHLQAQRSRWKSPMTDEELRTAREELRTLQQRLRTRARQPAPADDAPKTGSTREQ
jgi:hypothetical protein